MGNRIKDRISDDVFIETCNNAESMASAAAELKLHFNSFKKRARELNCYRTNQGGKGNTKVWKNTKIKTADILKGKYPHYGTFKIKRRLLKEGYFTNECAVCHVIDWQGMPLPMELDHIDGDRTNHLRENLRLLCPNCHAQTPTYRSKNRRET